MNLILKRRHRRYTILSTLAVIPILVTFLASLSVLAFNLAFARRILVFLLDLQAYIQAILWLALPLVSAFMAHQAYKRGSIGRWKPINRWVAVTAQWLLGLTAVIILIHLLA